MRIVIALCLLCLPAASSEYVCDDNDCLDDFNEVDDVIARGGPRFACRPLTEYIECLAEQLGECPTQHRTAVLGAKSRWTQYISSCALTLPFQEGDSREDTLIEQVQRSAEDTLTEQVQRGTDEVRNQLNGIISLSQPNDNRLIIAPENTVIEKMVDVAEDIVENVKDTVDEVIDSSMDGPDGMDDIVENVRDIIVSKINSAQPILQQYADKLETKTDDENNSNVEDIDEAQSEETDDTHRKEGDDRHSTETDIIPTLESVSVEVLDDIVDFLNDHLSADDGNIETELDVDDSGAVDDSREENDDSKDTELEGADDSSESIDNSKDDEDNETDDSKEIVDDNSDNTDLDVSTDNSDENEINPLNDESNENDSDEIDDDSHDETEENQSQNDSDENDSHDDHQVKIGIDDSDENNSYRHGENDDSQDDDQNENSNENDNVSSDEDNDSHHHEDSHEHLQELGDLTVLSDPSTGTANVGGNARLRPGMGVGSVHQYSSMGDDNSGSLITPWTTLLVACVALVISTLS